MLDDIGVRIVVIAVVDCSVAFLGIWAGVVRRRYRRRLGASNRKSSMPSQTWLENA
jgi:hypothetical protein